MNEQVETAGRVALRTGRVFGGLVCLAFVLAGTLFGLLIGREAWADLQTQMWAPISCTILPAETPDQRSPKSGPYSVRIRFEYRWNQERHVSDRVRRRSASFDNYQDVQRLLDRYRPNTTATCRVNPARPSEAVLEKSAPWIALALVIPLAFVIVGVVGFYAAVFGHGQSGPGGLALSVAGTHSESPVSNRTGPAGSRPGCLFLFFLLFFAVGTVAFYVAFVAPQWQQRAAAGWDRVPCKILSSEVEQHRSKGSSTYSVKILYEYQVGGRPYRANRYNFFRVASSGRENKEAVVRRFPPGRETSCYVNPRDPTDAVLEKNAGAGQWLGLLPLIFVAIGLTGMIHAVRTWRRGSGELTERQKPTAPRTTPIEESPDTPLVLRSTKGRLGKLIGVLIFAVFWNGIISIFVMEFVQAVLRGNVDWVLGLFLTPFVVVGLVVLGLIGYYGLACFAPRPMLTLARRQIRLGESVDVDWQFSGGTQVIEKLRIYLEGTEEARYRRGTSTSTDRNVFALIEIANATTPEEVRRGHGQLHVPADAVPTWSSPNNAIVWTLRVKGVIHLYPDIDDAFPLTLLPSARSRPPLADPT